MNKETIYNQVKTFNEKITNTIETKANKFYYVSDEEALDRSAFINYLIDRYSDVKNLFDRQLKIMDLAYGSGNLTTKIILENNIDVSGIHLNDKFADDANKKLHNILKQQFNKKSIIKTTDFSFFEHIKFKVNSVDVLIFNPTSGGKPAKKDYNRTGNKTDIKLTIEKILNNESIVIFNGKEEEFSEIFPSLNNIFKYIPKVGNDFFIGFKKEESKNPIVFHNDEGNIIEFKDNNLSSIKDKYLDKLEDDISDQIQLIKPPRDESSIISISEKPEITDKREKELLAFFNSLPKERKDKILNTLGKDNILDLLDKEHIIEILANQDLEKEDLDILLGRREALNIFNKNLNKDSKWLESDWQEFFDTNPWIFGYGLNYQYLKILQKESHVSGVDLDGKNEVIGDFLMGASKFTVLVELKKPETPLFEKDKNRSESWKLSKDLIYSISQILTQKAEWIVKARTDCYTKDGKLIKHKTSDPKTILIIGHSNQHSGEDKKFKIKSETFELYRRNSRNIEILTYDELYERAYFLVNQKEV